jgi:hypothetical protein
MTDESSARLRNLTFGEFASLARDPTLSKYEKIGFPDSYRAGYEPAIFGDISRKLGLLDQRGGLILDIGPGCSDLPLMLVEYCRTSAHELVLVDSQEMLDLLPSQSFITKVPGPFPSCNDQLESYAGRVDAILCYSVLQYVFAEADVFEFLDASLELLAPGGSMLIGDIPNESMRTRFLSSKEGLAFHQRHHGPGTKPEINVVSDMKGKINDSVVLNLLTRARRAGAHAYVLEQSSELPMASRREDIVIRRP